MKRLLVFIVAVVMLLTTLGFTPSEQAQAEGEQQAVRVEIVDDLREVNSDTYLLSDGSFECVVYSEDKYYKDTHGEYKEIDNTIIGASRSDNWGEYAYKNASNDTMCSFSASKPSVLIEAAEGTIAFSIKSEKDSKAITGGIKEYGEIFDYPLCGNSSIAYYEALKSTDFVYTVANGMLKEFIILKDASSASEIGFSFKTDGLTMRKAEDGTIEFVDKEGNKTFELSSLFAVDAAGAYTDELNYNIVSTDKTSAEISVALSNEYLNAPERVFPILIDPSIMITGSSNIYDSYVSSANPEENYQLYDELRTGKDTTHGVCRTYIKFVIPSSVSGDITTSYIRIKKKSGDAPNVYAYPVSDTWSSGTITWKNKKGIIKGIQSTLSQHTSDGWYRLGVTEIVSMWVTGTYANYGFMLKDTRENRYSKSTVFFSSDADSPNKPELHIIYNNPVETNCVYMIKNISKGKYLSVRGNTSVVELADKDAMDGRQLWYVVANGSKYKLYSMGHRDSESYGAVESLLRGNSPGSKPKFTTPAGSYTNWEIKQDGAVFYIKNTWQSSSTALTAASSGNAVSLVNASNAADNAKWRLEKITTSTFNNYWTGSYYINGHRIQKGEKVYIKVDLVESGNNSVYLNNVLKKSDFNIVKQWNGLSDNIKICGPDDNAPSGANVLHVTFKGSKSPENSFGSTNPHSVSNEEINLGQDWDKVEVVFSVGINDRSTLYGKPKDFIERVILHEMGHVLKLAHTTVTNYIDHSVPRGRGKYDNSNKVCSIMNTGENEPNLNCSRPKWHDIINLRNKWG